MLYSFDVFKLRLCLYALCFALGSLSPALAVNSSRNFGGVGIDGVQQADGQIMVRQLVVGGPAHLCGIRVGDIITHIDGKPTRGSNLRQLTEYRLRGQAGTNVTLKIHRPDTARSLTFTLTRRQLVVPAPKRP